MNIMNGIPIGFSNENAEEHGDKESSGTRSIVQPQIKHETNYREEELNPEEREPLTSSSLNELETIQNETNDQNNSLIDPSKEEKK